MNGGRKGSALGRILACYTFTEANQHEIYDN